MKQNSVSNRVPADETSRMDLSIRCDMCGMEHKVAIFIEVDDDHHDPLVTLRLEEPTAIVYPGH